METLQEKSLKFNSNMVVSNDGGQLSNDAGLLLLFEFLHKIKFDEMLKEFFHLNDSRAYCIHEYEDILKQLIIQLIAGYPQDSAANRLRLDPILKQGIGKDQLASQSMISRFIHELTEENVAQFQQIAKGLADDWIHHGDHGIHAASGGPAQVLDARFHIHDHQILLAGDYMPDERLDERIGGTHAARAARIDGAHDHQLHIVGAGAAAHLHNVVHFGVHLEHAHRHPGSLLHQVFMLRDRLWQLLDSQSRAQVHARINIDGQDVVTIAGKEPGQGSGQGGLAHTAFS